MDLLFGLLNFLDATVIEPVTDKFLGIFDLNGRFGVAFLVISYLVAWGLYRYRRRTGATQASSYWQFLGGSRVHFHRSALLDYQYYFLRAVLKVLFVVPVVGIVDPYIFSSGDWMAFMTNLWGERPRLGEDMGLMVIYGLGVFLVGGFAHYWVHRAFHSRWLWEFHKVHHSAPVLVPATASRIHFVEKIGGRLAYLTLMGLYAGTFYYMCGGEVSRYTLFGVTYLVFIFNTLAANLRHTHVWLSFGPRVERWINSPAQHQIHHSDNPRHFNKNFGTNLSIWDRMFGTLYVTTPEPENITFGIGEAENRKYQSLGSLVFMPFVVIFRRWIGRLGVRRVAD